MSGPFNVDSTVSSIDVTISDAIMELQVRHVSVQMHFYLSKKIKIHVDILYSVHVSKVAAENCNNVKRYRG